MAKQKLSRDQKRKQKKRKQQQRKQKPTSGGLPGRGGVSHQFTVGQPDPAQLAAAAAAYQAQEARILQVFGVEEDDDDGEFPLPPVNRENLQIFGDHLKAHLQLPCLLTGIESIGYFAWEERFEFGYGSAAEHARLREQYGSLDDEFMLEQFEMNIKIFGFTYDIVVKVKRTSDGKWFNIPLSELEAVDQDSDNAVLLNDFTVWKVNW